MGPAWFDSDAVPDGDLDDDEVPASAPFNSDSDGGFGFCDTPGCVEAGEHFYPRECATAAFMAKWLAGERKLPRNLRRPGIKGAFRSAHARARRIARRHGPGRLARRAWDRAVAAERRFVRRLLRAAEFATDLIPF